MSVFNDISFPILADGWGELLWILFIFGIYAVGAITKMLSSRKGESDAEKSSSGSSYVVELAKKRARQRQEQAQLRRAKQTSVRKPKQLSDWDRLQEAKRHRREQLRQKAKESSKPVVSPPAYQRPKPIPQPELQPQPARKMTDLMQEALSSIITPQMQPRPRTVQKPQPKRRPVPQPRKKPAKIIKSSRSAAPEDSSLIPTRTLETFFSNPNELRTAIILKEILDKPIALREEW